MGAVPRQPTSRHLSQTRGMAAAVETRKRVASPFLDEEFSAPPHLVKRSRFSPCAGLAVQRPSLVFDPLDAPRRVFPDADSTEIEGCFVASGLDIHATVEAFRARQAREAVASCLARAAARADGGGMDECAGILVEQMAAAEDVADAKNRASWILALVKDAVAARAAEAATSALREENAALRAQAQALERDNAVLKRGVAAQHKLLEETERDNAVLKRGVAAQHRRQEEMERAAAELKKKVAELEMANYALGVRLRNADSCRFQACRGPDMF
ncbi:uncharacterized protein LOC133918269 [Phragmites australis]|uniref:uncharacterized protein LOC133918269 n=1 Tax=Phragmites australis TaxID=29695 RepID=UPI002D79904B|nr:uncharacterized protein LOC133918269 [Phragmites australis]